MDVVDRLVGQLRAVDVDAVDDLLRSLDASERAAARAWFDRSRRWFPEADPYTGFVARPDDPRPDHEQRLAAHTAWRWLEGMCAVALCGPATAARRVPWRDMWDYQESPGEAALVHLLWDAEAEWVADFVAAASRVGLGSNARNSSGTLTRVLRAAVLHHRLPAPDGPTFHLAWLSGSWRGSLLETLRQDPLVPDLVHHHLAAGHGGQQVQDLPEVLAVLVAEGRLDRARLVEQVLQLLTVQQRVSSQRVLAGLLRTLGVTSSEVPGGLPYLLGVLATSHGSVGAAVLPLALELVTDAEGLHELVAVVAGRPERGQKAVLLRGVQADRIRTTVGDDQVAAGLAALVEGDEDAAFVAEVTAVRAGLGHAATTQPAAPARLGLWHREPAVPDPSPQHAGAARTTAVELLRPGPHTFAPGFLDRTLQELAEGRFRSQQLVLTARHLARAGELSASGTTRLLEELFLAGAMRLVWPTALEIADAACAASRRPAGLAGLLRMLASYAHEVPEPGDVPAGIARLAASDRTSKAQSEALRLGAAIAHEPVQAYARRLRTAPPSPAEPAVVRGLWQPPAVHHPLPSSQPVPPPAPVDLAELSRRRHGDDLYSALHLEHAARPGALAQPSLLLADVVRAAREQGADAVRRALSGPHRYGGGPVGEALGLWVAGALTVPVFWRLAHDATTLADAQEQVRRDPDLSTQERWAVAALQPVLDDQVQRSAPVLPWVLNWPAPRLTFLLACESLLRAEQAPVLLSTPTWQDGSLDLDVLVARLRASQQAGVGPLDLVQALYRLRPADAALARTLDLPPVRTVTALTDPTGRTSLDATGLLRTWVAAGGLPALRTSLGPEGDRWRSTADVPVSWDVCSAAPRGLLGGGEGDLDAAAVARVFPLWPDLTALGAHLRAWQPPARFLAMALLGGTFGVACHDTVLASSSDPDLLRRTQCLDVLGLLLAHDRLDPEHAAAAALGRQAAGTLDLERSVLSWEQVFESGGLRGMWPLALAVAGALCDLQPCPAGLPALLRLLTGVAHEVPDPTVPEGVCRLADAAGSSAEQVAARTLVTALRRAEAAP